MSESKPGERVGRGPLASVSDSLRSVDILLNGKRQDLVKRLREGSTAWDKRRQSFLDGQKNFTGQQSRKRQRDSSEITHAIGFLRDSDFQDPNEVDITALLRGSEGISLDRREVTSSSLKRRNPNVQHLLRTLNNLQTNWAVLALQIQQKLPFAQDGELDKPRFKFVTLKPKRFLEGSRPPALKLSLEEILKPFSGLSQVLGDKTTFKTLDDLNRMIQKATEELEAMREDKLNDGRPLGPLQKEALRRKQEKQMKGLKSSLREPGRHVAIYTTASLPWMTGTAVNPLLRAAYLARDPKRKVTLVIPWLAKPDQSMVFPNGQTFQSPEEQEAFVRKWVKQRTGLDCPFAIKFYPSRYAEEKCSILPVGDPTAYISDSEADVAVLEEPEHLNWYHHGRRWTDKFKHVVGIIHTNYLDYAMREEDGERKAKALAIMNQLICRIHCHKVVKLSDAVQALPKQVTAFVHGVPHAFIRVGEAKAKAAKDGDTGFDRGAYFIGKAVWAKGYTELLDLMDKHAKRGVAQLHVDCYGSGEDLEEMKEFAANRKLDMAFHGGRDHLDDSMHRYRVFVNPSKSDVVATTTAEALAMGKWVVVHDLPCNRFFKTFSNCLVYETPEQFSEKLEYAMKNLPHPMTKEERTRLTWEAATERFLDVAELRGEERVPPRVSATVDTLAFNLHNYLTGLEPLRAVSGAGVNTRDNPLSLSDFIPSDQQGGLFDDKKRIRARAAKATS